MYIYLFTHALGSVVGSVQNGGYWGCMEASKDRGKSITVGSPRMRVFGDCISLFLKKENQNLCFALKQALVGERGWGAEMH